MPWSIRVPLRPDESLSSWLARAALLQGCDPLALTGAVWPEWRAWTVDIDRGVSADRLRLLSTASGIRPARFARASLRADAKTVAGRALADAETWPWLLALGSRNRRRHGGQQFCPMCLAEDAQPYFRRRWRFACNVACARHRALLVDQCDPCGTPVTFHRLLAEDEHLACCSGCHGDLRQAGGGPAPSDVTAFQSMADDVLASGAGVIWDHSVAAAEWFATVRFLVDAIRRASRHRRSRLAASISALGIDLPERAVPVTGLPLEMLSVVDRCTLLGAAYGLMRVDFAAWIAALRRSKVTAATLSGDDQCVPEPVQAVAASLRSGRTGARRMARSARATPRSEAAVMGAWARMQRRARASGP